MKDDIIDGGGEGNRKADKRYRDGVRETVSDTTSAERAEKARNISEKALDEAKDAEAEGRSHAKK